MRKPAVVPAALTPSRLAFYLPPTIQSDFTNLQSTDHPHFTETFEHVRSWPDRDEENPEWIRAAYFPVDWKSKMGNSDNSANFKTDWNIDITKGDIMLRDNGEIQLITWQIKEHMNNQATQAEICNLYLTVKRHIAAQADSRGYVVTPAYDDIITYNHPAVFMTYAGRPDYMPSYGTPGINADSLVTVKTQFNDVTRQIAINDEFEHGMFTYRVINVDWGEVDINLKNGLVTLNCKRVAGGMV